MCNKPPQAGDAFHPLEAGMGVTPEQIEALHRQWIDSAEQVLALASSPDTRGGLLRLLGCSETELEAVLGLLRARAGRAVAADMEHPIAGGALGLKLPATPPSAVRAAPPPDEGMGGPGPGPGGGPISDNSPSRHGLP